MVSVIQALQAKPDNDQVVDFIKQASETQRMMGYAEVAAPSSESIALFAKRQLLGAEKRKEKKRREKKSEKM